MQIVLGVNISVHSPDRGRDLFSINPNEKHNVSNREKVFYALKESDRKTRTTSIKFINDKEQWTVGTVENSVGHFG